MTNQLWLLIYSLDPTEQTNASHLLQRLDAEHFQALPQDFRGEVAEHQTARALGGFGFEHGTLFVETREVTGEVVEIIAKKVRPIFFRDGFQDDAEVEQSLGQREFSGFVQLNH